MGSEIHAYTTSPGRSRNMAAIRSADTKIETAVRSALHRHGYRFRKDFPLVEGGVRSRPDIVFPRRRIVVFLDGCFWHGCHEHGRKPTVNREYWNPKLDGNVARDRRQAEALTRGGWDVLRFWEHEDLDVIVTTIIEQLQSRYA